jgi:hypothetical protein
MNRIVVRLGWFGLLGALFANRDMCFGGPGNPEPPPPPSDAAPEDGSSDGASNKDARLYIVQPPRDVAS